MANYSSMADIFFRAQEKAGEPTNGNSSYSTGLISYLSDVQRTLVAGGTIFDTNIDEVWPWARSPHNIVISILPKYTTGTVTVTNGSNAATLSVSPGFDLTGWYLRFPLSNNETYRIAGHPGTSSTSISFDSNFFGTSASGLTFEIYKLDYEVIESYIYINGSNHSFDFNEVTGNKSLQVQLNHGIYTPAAFATALAALMTTESLDNGNAYTYSVNYNQRNDRRFRITSGGELNVFSIAGEQGPNRFTSGWPSAGFTFTNDYAGAADYRGSYPFGGIARLIEPIRFIGTGTQQGEVLLESTDPINFAQNFSYREAKEGTPTCFTKISEDYTGKITIRLNNYPEQTSRLEIAYCPVPLDLASIDCCFPILPQKYYNFLEYAAVYFLLVEKEDTKAETYLAMAKAELQAMQKHYRAEIFRTNNVFGYVAPRGTSERGPWYNRLRYGYDKDRW